MTSERFTNAQGAEFEIVGVFLCCHKCGFTWNAVHKAAHHEDEFCPECRATEFGEALQSLMPDWETYLE